MKAFVHSDLQAGEGPTRRRTDPATPLQRWRVARFYTWAAQLVHERKLDAVWDLGDTTDDRTAIAHPTLQVVAAGCRALTAGISRVTSFKVLGNHEQSTKNTAVHCGDLFTPYFHVVPDRGVFSLSPTTFVVAASFPQDHAELGAWISQAITKIKADGSQAIVLGHFQVTGARLNSGTAGNGINHDDLAGADLVLLGHVHRGQRVGKNGYYLGSPFQQDFGEANDPVKVCAIVDTETLKVEWVHPPGFPRYRTVSVDDLDSDVGDDVLNVVLRSPAEAERFYVHPLAASCEPTYAFATTEATSFSGDLQQLSYADLTRLYVSQNQLAGFTPEELLMALPG